MVNPEGWNWAVPTHDDQLIVDTSASTPKPLIAICLNPLSAALIAAAPELYAYLWQIRNDLRFKSPDTLTDFEHRLIELCDRLRSDEP